MCTNHEFFFLFFFFIVDINLNHSVIFYFLSKIENEIFFFVKDFFYVLILY